ncbi:hypothetical protein CERSUDRAFT_70079 [Gelatoporia subvermispora B]|uniref:Uncharacterized protein n=1 Tax=Ceriporiopsis subvermispora (strain B) TaxID=914234 RepID=M2QWQ4_CERS8|nr:hypothetical protein CERSUDRAFT_70079 [Gelatoporia subvermispora B]
MLTNRGNTGLFHLPGLSGLEVVRPEDLCSAHPSSQIFAEAKAGGLIMGRITTVLWPLLREYDQLDRRIETDLAPEWYSGGGVSSLWADSSLIEVLSGKYSRQDIPWGSALPHTVHTWPSHSDISLSLWLERLGKPNSDGREWMATLHRERELEDTAYQKVMPVFAQLNIKHVGFERRERRLQAPPRRPHMTWYLVVRAEQIQLTKRAFEAARGCPPAADNVGSRHGLQASRTMLFLRRTCGFVYTCSSGGKWAGISTHYRLTRVIQASKHIPTAEYSASATGRPVTTSTPRKVAGNAYGPDMIKKASLMSTIHPSSSKRVEQDPNYHCGSDDDIRVFLRGLSWGRCYNSVLWRFDQTTMEDAPFSASFRSFANVKV